MKKKNIICIILLLLVSMLLFSGCSNTEEATGPNHYRVYYLNREDTKIEALDYEATETETLKLVKELIEVMSKIPDNVNLHEAIHGFEVVAYSITDDQVHLVVNDNYKNLEATTEVLTRAALVRTLTQIKGIKVVSMKVREQELTDSLGNQVGPMTASQFVDNAGNEINSYEKVKLTLFFASEDGTHLVKANRTVVYNSNISVEKLVVEQLISGPTNEEIFPTINANTKIVSVTVKDNICYVNLDEGFLSQVSNVSAQVTLYSVVNSLIELPNVNKVQISINGNTDLVFREIYDLNTVFERELELVK